VSWFGAEGFGSTHATGHGLFMDFFGFRNIFPRSATVQKHRKNAKEILTPVIEERVRHLNDPNYKRSVCYNVGYDNAIF
jgi:hypothetical protein